MSLRKIAEIEGVSHQCIAEILERALRKFKKRLADRGIRIEDIL